VKSKPRHSCTFIL